jgi:hypothetical protein
MRSKTSLFLIEMLVMVLVFALCAALCVQLFARAEEISLETARQEEALLIAQNAAELLRSGMTAEAVAQTLAGDWGLDIEPLQTEVAGLQKAQITVCFEEMPIFSLVTGWQEVGG